MTLLKTKKIISILAVLFLLLSLNTTIAQRNDGDFNTEEKDELIITSSTDATKVLINKPIEINARRTYKADGIVTFKSNPSSGVFSPSNTCKLDYQYKCSVKFTSEKEGSFTISATYKSNKNISYTSNNLVIKVQTKIEKKEGGNPEPTKINTDTTYTPLAPLPGINTPGCVDKDGNPCINTQKNDTTNPCPFGNYLNIMIKLILGIAGVLAMVMIVMGGIEYMTSELVSGKAAGKETITNAILGLLMALGSFLILNTVNPKLLDVCLNNLPEATITIGGDENSAPFSPIDQSKLTNLGVYCPGKGGKNELEKIATSFQKINTKYSQDPRNVVQNNVLYIDCSSFVKQVYKCAGLNFSGDRTANIFPGKTKISKIENGKINDENINVGDLLGWMNGETKYKGGHVIMYIGNNQTIEVHSGKPVVVKQPLSYYGNALKYIVKP